MTPVIFALLAASAGAAIEALRRVRDRGGHAAVVAAVACAAAAVPPLVGMSLVASVIAGLSVLVLVAVLRRAERARRAERRARQIPHVADHLADALGAGLSLPAALLSASEVTPEPMATELKATMTEISVGRRVEGALEDLQARVGDPALDVVVSAIAIQRISGGDLSKALRDLSLRLSERERLAREVLGATAQARMTGSLVASLPLVVGVALEVARPGLVVGLLGGPALALAAVSLALQGVGILLIRRIARVAV